MDYDKINYEEGDHLKKILLKAEEKGYDSIEAIKEYTSMETQYQKQINKDNKPIGFISEEAKKLATKEIIKIISEYVPN